MATYQPFTNVFYDYHYKFLETSQLLMQAHCHMTIDGNQITYSSNKITKIY